MWMEKIIAEKQKDMPKILPYSQIKGDKFIKDESRWIINNKKERELARSRKLNNFHFSPTLSLIWGIKRV